MKVTAIQRTRKGIVAISICEIIPGKDAWRCGICKHGKITKGQPYCRVCYADIKFEETGETPS